ncbi:hypothetical protein SME17J_47210 (plasmid) [Serratia marcescens]|nr:hypothetical protein SME17J_47210 [Serratia marcescens]
MVYFMMEKIFVQTCNVSNPENPIYTLNDGKTFCGNLIHTQHATADNRDCAH